LIEPPTSVVTTKVGGSIKDTGEQVKTLV